MVTGRTLDFADTPDTTVVHPSQVCQDCGAPLADVPPTATERRQVFDLPPMKLGGTEFQAQTCSCPACGKVNTASFPHAIAHPGHYGPGVKARTTC